jgi:hypothetical protein
MSSLNLVCSNDLCLICGVQELTVPHAPKLEDFVSLSAQKLAI